MLAKFLLGPAGSGKTWTCVNEVQKELIRSPEGPPLIFVAPKQATFQIERQVLSGEALSGFTRLQILSFERLAKWVLEQVGSAVPRALTTQGRMMVLRAMIMEMETELKVFRSSCRSKGFASELGNLFAELVQYKVRSDHLEDATERLALRSLREKVRDVALILKRYREWKRKHGLIDPEEILQYATEAIVAHRHASSKKAHEMIGGLWLDGFAEMTTAEVDFLVSVIPHAGQSTLAFCLADKNPRGLKWHSSWNIVAQSYRRLEMKLRDGGIAPRSEYLKNHRQLGRFNHAPQLKHLEQYWEKPSTWMNPEPLLPAQLEMVACNRPEAEAVHAARQILRHVRNKGRYRECAVIVRSLEGWHAILRRVFESYRIPYFMDRREPISHHPLTELTRSVIRLAAFDWPHEDWFSILKTGLAWVSLDDVDELENEALEHGWKKQRWLESLDESEKTPEGRRRCHQRWNAGRERIVQPFLHFLEALRDLDFEPNGKQLCQELMRLWNALEIEKQLRDWAVESEGNHVHETVWNEMDRWLANVETALGDSRMNLRSWLQVLDAGLDHLTVGVVPPKLDQVMIGAIDRSRSPRLKLVMVLGLNEGQFPTPPGSTSLLTDADRKGLDEGGIHLAPDRRAQIGRERFYGYIAFTRSSEKLILSWSDRGAGGEETRASSLVARVRSMFPDSVVGHFSEEDVDAQPEAECELRSRMIRHWHADPDLELQMPPEWDALQRNLRPVIEGMREDRLSTEWSTALYGDELKGSVSRLEQFAQCPFQFFVGVGLKAQERKQFEVDARERGSFQHEALQLLHERIRESGLKWSSVDPDQAVAILDEVTTGLRRTFRDGLFEHEAKNRFEAGQMVQQLRQFVRTIFGWLNTYQLEPVAVELPFGMKEEDLGRPSEPAWTIELEGGQRIVFRGIIDRVDAWEDPQSGDVFFSVMDYKSSERRIDRKLLDNGIQIQLPAYAKALLNANRLGSFMPGRRIHPSGFFYLNLRGSFSSAPSRDEVISDPDSVLRKAYQHHGSLDSEHLDLFDSGALSTGQASGQFGFTMTPKGNLRKGGSVAVPAETFQKVLDQTEALVRQMGEEIFQGRIEVAPYRKGSSETACDQCDYRSVCRFNPWVQAYRILKPNSRKEGDK